MEFRIKKVKVGNLKIKLLLFEPQHGSNRFDYSNILGHYFRNVHGIILVYDISDHYSFENLIHYHEMIQVYSGSEVIKILVGNKFDKQDFVVTEEEGHNFAIDYNYLFYQTSAKNNYNVNEVFDLIVKKMLKANIILKEKYENEIITNRDIKNDNKKKCLII